MVTAEPRCSLERRLRVAKIGRFKPLCDFGWTGPAQCDQGAIADLMGLDFVKAGHNVVLIGPNGVGKTTRAQYRPSGPLGGLYRALYGRRPDVVGELAALDSDSALRRRLRAYAAFDLLRPV